MITPFEVEQKSESPMNFFLADNQQNRQKGYYVLKM